MKIAITGGIGSGKSYVCHILESLGMKVYDCDAAAKRLMRSDIRLQEALIQLVGEEIYKEERRVFQKQVLAKFLLASEANKQAVNEVVHPFVARDFERSGCDWLESAILFDSGFDKRSRFDYVVCVTAPESVRLQRVMARDHISCEKAQEWMAAQLPQEEVLKRSNFEIINDGESDIVAQISQLMKNINKNKK